MRNLRQWPVASGLMVIGVLVVILPPAAGQAPAVTCEAAGPVKFVCGQAGPEDLVAVPSLVVGRWSCRDAT